MNVFPKRTVHRPRQRMLAALTVSTLALTSLVACAQDSAQGTQNASQTPSFSFDPDEEIEVCTGPGCGDDVESDEGELTNSNPDGWDTPTVPDRAKTEATKERFAELTPRGGETEPVAVSDELRAFVDSGRKDNAEDPLTIGSQDADVVVQVYLDFQCPYCANASLEMDPVLREAAEAGEIRLEYNNYPVLGEHSVLAALGWIAATEQGKMWEYHDAIYDALADENPMPLDFEGVVSVAEQVGVEDLDKFKETMMAEESADMVIADTTKAIDDLGIRYVPAYFVGYSFLDIEGDADDVRTVLDLEANRQK